MDTSTFLHHMLVTTQLVAAGLDLDLLSFSSLNYNCTFNSLLLRMKKYNHILALQSRLSEECTYVFNLFVE